MPDISKPLEARDKGIDFDQMLGKVTFNEGDNTGGFYCDICQSVFRDSINYLDHINGKKHIRMMGMSFKTSRATLEDVRNALKDALNKRRSKKIVHFSLSEHVETMKKEEEAKREQHKLLKKEKKRKREETALQTEADLEMERMLGFSAFGTSKKG